MYRAEVFRDCLHPRSLDLQCDHETMDKLYNGLKCYKIDYDRFKQDKQNLQSVNDLSLKRYIDSSLQKHTTYTDYPPVVDVPAGTYIINMNTMRWFFKKGYRLDDEDAHKLFGNTRFTSYGIGYSGYKEILDHTDSRSPNILHALCQFPYDISKEIKDLINKGIKPTDESFEICMRYRSTEYRAKILNALES